jgi:hypothetical protein
VGAIAIDLGVASVVAYDAAVDPGFVTLLAPKGRAMTTIRIDDTMVGLTVAQRGASTALRFLVSGGDMFANFTLVDDAPPFDVSPKQIFNCDMLGFATNQNGMLPSPFVIFEDQSIGFGNLTIAAIPKNSVFEIDASGALATPVRLPPVYASEALRAAAQQRLDDAIITAERIRTWRPTPSVVMPEPPPPPLPDPELTKATAIAGERAAAARIARDRASGPVVIGPSQAEIETALTIAVRRSQAANAASLAASDAMMAIAAQRTAQRHREQLEALSLLHGG